MAVEAYGNWKVLGDTAFTLMDLEFETATEADMFREKLMLIESFQNQIQQSTAARQEAELAREKNKPRRGEK